MFGLAVFASANLFFAVLDLTGKPEFLLKYKMQDEKNVPVSYLHSWISPGANKLHNMVLLSCLDKAISIISLIPNLSRYVKQGLVN